MRDLISTGLLPIKKAFVKFNVKSLLPPDAAKAVENIRTHPKDGGPNPNIRTTLQFEIKIPSDTTFCPRMTCEVYDQLYFEGMAQPQVGTFTLKIGDIINEARTQDYETKADLQRIIEIMQTIREKQIAGEEFAMAELVYTLDSQIKSASKNKAINNQNVGEKLLKEFERNGIDLPSSSALKNGGKPTMQRKDSVPAEGPGAKTGDDIKDILGKDARNKVRLAYEAKIAKDKAELEVVREEE